MRTVNGNQKLSTTVTIAMYRASTGQREMAMANWLSRSARMDFMCSTRTINFNLRIRSLFPTRVDQFQFLPFVCYCFFFASLLFSALAALL